ncbi:hypothetical protein JCM10212_000079 [Sporobolomyces blumeae]
MERQTWTLFKGQTSLKAASPGVVPIFSTTKCDVAVPNGSRSAPPESFKLEWSSKDPSIVLDHELYRIVADLVSDELVAFQASSTYSSLEFCFRSRNASSRLRQSSDAVAWCPNQYSTNNVLFLFPSHGSSPARHLWTNSPLLSNSSTYWSTFFSAPGYAETDPRIKGPALPSELFQPRVEGSETGSPATKEESSALAKPTVEEKPIQTRPSTPADEENDGFDSDSENDLHPAPADLPPIYRIDVKHMAYRTLLCYFEYLKTGVPPTCSPKSMFVLSSFYEHGALRELSFKSYKSQLGSNNALVELFSNLTEHDEIKDVAMQAVLDNWLLIRESKAMEDLRRAFKAGELDERRVDLFFELLAKLKAF